MREAGFCFQCQSLSLFPSHDAASDVLLRGSLRLKRRSVQHQYLDTSKSLDLIINPCLHDEWGWVARSKFFHHNNTRKERKQELLLSITAAASTSAEAARLPSSCKERRTAKSARQQQPSYSLTLTAAAAVPRRLTSCHASSFFLRENSVSRSCVEDQSRCGDTHSIPATHAPLITRSDESREQTVLSLL